ncbi:MAG: DHA2 family efflux MFS transporter permease subunit [Pseudomonadota bacterium]
MTKNYKFIIATIYTIVLFLDRLDLTIANITLPTIARYFDVSIVVTDGISLSFLLALAISIPLSAWLGDHFGLKRIYILAMLLFGLGSTLCSVSTSLNQLIFLRFLQGLGGGLLIPVGMTMIYRAYDKSEYASITSFTFLPSLVAPAIAPFLGGLILDSFGWRFVFLFSGPICLFLAILSAYLLEEEPYKRQSSFDWFGFVLGEMILMDIFYGLFLLGKNGFSATAIITGLICPPLIWLFIKIEQQTTHPFIDLSFFKNKTFYRANLIQICFQICHFGAIFIIGLFLQAGIGFSATLAGLMMGMQAVGAMMTSRFSVKLFNQYGGKLPIIIGFLGIAVTTPLILLIDKSSMLYYGILLFLVRGFFSGLCGTPIQTLSVIGFEKQDIGSINSIFNICRQAAISLGVAVSSILVAIGLHFTKLTGTDNIQLNEAFSVFSYGFFIIPIIALAGIFITSQLGGNPPLMNKGVKC